MASPSIATLLKYDALGDNGTDLTGAVFDISGVTPDIPSLLAVVGDPDGSGGLRAFVRMYSKAGRLLYYREMVTNGTHLGVPAWKHDLVFDDDAVNTIKFVQRSGAITGGYFRLGYQGVYTAKVNPVSMTAASFQSVLEAHPDIGPGNVQVTYDGPNNKFNIEFIGDFTGLKLSSAFVLDVQTIGGSLSIGTTQNGTSDIRSTQEHYWWDVVGYDGETWSGGVGGSHPRNGMGPQPCELWFDFPATITNESPADEAEIDIPRPWFEWESGSGTILQVPIVSRRFVIDELDGSSQPVQRIVNDLITGPNLNARTNFRPDESVTLKDDTDYRWIVTVTKESGQVTTAEFALSIDYERPTAGTPTPTVEMINENAFASATWSASTVDPSDFTAYVWKVRPAAADEESPLNIEVWRHTSQSRTFARIAQIPKNQPIILSFYVEQLNDDDVVVLSQPVEFPMTVTIDSAMLAGSDSQDLVWAALKYHDGRIVDYTEDPVLIQPRGQLAPIAVHGGARSRRGELTARIDGDVDAQMAVYRRIERMYLADTGGSYVYTDADGQMFPVVLGPPQRNRRAGRWPLEVTVQFNEVHAPWRWSR